MYRDGKTGHLSKPKLFNIKLRLMRNTDHKNDTYLSTPVCISQLIRVDWTTGPLHAPKLFNVKLRLMRHIDHKNGTPSEARRPRLVTIYRLSNVSQNVEMPALSCEIFLLALTKPRWYYSM